MKVQCDTNVIQLALLLCTVHCAVHILNKVIIFILLKGKFSIIGYKNYIYIKRNGLIYKEIYPESTIPPGKLKTPNL